MAISKNIIERMDGKIWIESEEGKGSAFIFTLKTQKGKEKAGDRVNAVIDWKTLNVLAVDDSDDVLDHFRVISDGAGFHCDTALNGEEAIAQFQKGNHYHVVFVDWKMPGMDGIELTKHIKEASDENTVIIMISAAEWTGD